MKTLETMHKHGTIRLLQDIQPDFDLQIGAHAEHVPVESRMM